VARAPLERYQGGSRVVEEHHQHRNCIGWNDCKIQLGMVKRSTQRGMRSVWMDDDSVIFVRLIVGNTTLNLGKGKPFRNDCCSVQNIVRCMLDGYGHTLAN
jgi:hypothetical protein